LLKNTATKYTEIVTSPQFVLTSVHPREKKAQKLASIKLQERKKSSLILL